MPAIRSTRSGAVGHDRLQQTNALIRGGLRAGRRTALRPEVGIRIQPETLELGGERRRRGPRLALRSRSVGPCLLQACGERLAELHERAPDPLGVRSDVAWLAQDPPGRRDLGGEDPDLSRDVAIEAASQIEGAARIGQSRRRPLDVRLGRLDLGLARRQEGSGISLTEPVDELAPRGGELRVRRFRVFGRQRESADRVLGGATRPGRPLRHGGRDPSRGVDGSAGFRLRASGAGEGPVRRGDLRRGARSRTSRDQLFADGARFVGLQVTAKLSRHVGVTGLVQRRLGSGGAVGRGRERGLVRTDPLRGLLGGAVCGPGRSGRLVEPHGGSRCVPLGPFPCDHLVVQTRDELGEPRERGSVSQPIRDGHEGRLRLGGLGRRLRLGRFEPCELAGPLFGRADQGHHVITGRKGGHQFTECLHALGGRLHRPLGGGFGVSVRGDPRGRRLQSVVPRGRGRGGLGRLEEFLPGPEHPRSLDLEQDEVRLRSPCPILGELSRYLEALVAEHPLEDVVALPVRCSQELCEAVLGQQDGAAERIEPHAEQLLHTFAHRLVELDRLDHLSVGRVGVEPLELVTALALSAETPLHPPHLPVDLEDELHVRGVTELVDERPRVALERRRLPVQREGDRLQQ